MPIRASNHGREQLCSLVQSDAGDTAVWSGELDEPQIDGKERIVSLRPARVWLSHQTER